ncbi:Adenosine receptor A2a [Pseudolycoriella hygida]|uniref:Adenosine receptor A2a n=1 Tax=Pseudolycoriella hygida TaxID=35572 RepID=A0A9Q0MVJ1_9DIPT|nr:Adenosine receptor A2a [Pseudolycoriella hygida]
MISTEKHRFLMESEFLSLTKLPYAFVEIIIATIALIGNGLVIFVFWREKKLQTFSNYHIMSLSVADLFVGLFAVPIAILIEAQTPREHYACLFLISMLLATCLISIFSRIGVSIDRYWAIVHPLSYIRNRNTKKSVYIIGACWTLAIMFGYLPIVGWHAGNLEAKCNFMKKTSSSYLVLFCFVCFIIPTTAFVFIYKQIYCVIHKKIKAEKSSKLHTVETLKKSTKVDIEELERMTTMEIKIIKKKEIKATKLMTIIVAFFILSWLPLHVMNMKCSVFKKCAETQYIRQVLVIATHVNSAVNPLFYAYHIKGFRKVWQKTFVLRNSMNSEQILHSK